VGVAVLVVLVGVAVLVGVVVVIPIVLVCKKKKRLSRNGLPSGKFLLMAYCNWRIIKFHPKQMTN